jgi:hypothetical protein
MLEVDETRIHNTQLIRVQQREVEVGKDVVWEGEGGGLEVWDEVVVGAQALAEWNRSLLFSSIASRRTTIGRLWAVTVRRDCTTFISRQREVKAIKARANRETD